jgi:phosphocarrier protein HPr
VADDLVERDCLVRNRMGLHARPAAKIVQAANRFRCDVTLSKDDQSVNGKSIMGVLMLAAAQGTSVHVRAEGEGAAEAVEAITRLFEIGFDEEM